MLKNVQAVFSFFFFLGRRARRFKGFVFLGLLPVVFAVIAGIMLIGRSLELTFVLTDILVAYDIQFLAVLLSLFYGVSVCSEEIEGRTLSYLTTRPITKTAIVLGKYAAALALSALIVGTGLTAAFLILAGKGIVNPAVWVTLLQYLGVLILSLAAYTSFFVFLGVVLKKSVLFGLAYGFGWETVIQYFPGSTQKFSIIHYVKSLLPSAVPVKAGKFSFLTFRLEPSDPLTAVLSLLAITAVFLTLACLVWSRREYLVED